MQRREERVALRGHKEKLTALAFSPDCQLIAIASQDYTVRVWDARTGQTLSVLPSRGFRQAVAFSPDGRYLAVQDQPISGGNETVQLYELVGRRERRLLIGHINGTQCLAFHPRRPLLGSGADDLTSIIWDLKTERIVRREVVGPSWVWSIAFVDNGRGLVTVVFHGPIVVNGLEGAAPPRRVGVPGGMRRFVIDRTRNTLIVAGEEGKLTRVSLPDLTVGHHLDKGHDGLIESIAISPNGRLLLTGGGTDHRVVLRDAESFEPLVTLPPWTGMVKDLAFDTTGRWPAIAGADCDVRLWDLELLSDELARLGLSWDQAPPAVEWEHDSTTTDRHSGQEVPAIRRTTSDPADESLQRDPFTRP